METRGVKQRRNHTRKKDRIMKKAYALKNARDAARQSYVEKAYERQWRDANDDSRTLNSNELTKFMAAERAAQMQDNIRKKQQEGSDNDDFLKEWQKQLDAIAAKDTAKQEKRHRANMAQAEGLLSRWTSTRSKDKRGTS